MFEVKKENVHRLVETKEEVNVYLLEGYVLLENNFQKEKKQAETGKIIVEESKFDSMGYTELKELAKESKIKGYTTMKKSELVDALKANL